MRSPLLSVAALALLLMLAPAQQAAAQSCDAEVTAAYQTCIEAAATQCGTTCCASYESPTGVSDACQEELTQEVFTPCITELLQTATGVALIVQSASKGTCYYPTSELASDSDTVVGIILTADAEDGSSRYIYGGPGFQKLTCDTGICPALSRAGSAFSRPCGTCATNSALIRTALNANALDDPSPSPTPSPKATPRPSPGASPKLSPSVVAKVPALAPRVAPAPGPSALPFAQPRSTGFAFAQKGSTRLQEQNRYISANVSRTTGTVYEASSEAMAWNSSCSVDLRITTNGTVTWGIVNQNTKRVVQDSVCRSNKTAPCIVTGVTLDPIAGYSLVGSTDGTSKYRTVYQINGTFYSGCSVITGASGTASAIKPSSTVWINHVDVLQPGIGEPYFAAYGVNATCITYAIYAQGYDGDLEKVPFPIESYLMSTQNITSWRTLDAFAFSKAAKWSVPRSSCVSNARTGECKGVVGSLDVTKNYVLVVIDGANGLTEEDLGLLDIYYRIAPAGGSCLAGQ